MKNFEDMTFEEKDSIDKNEVHSIINSAIARMITDCELSEYELSIKIHDCDSYSTQNDIGRRIEIIKADGVIVDTTIKFHSRFYRNNYGVLRETGRKINHYMIKSKVSEESEVENDQMRLWR